MIPEKISTKKTRQKTDYNSSRQRKKTLCDSLPPDTTNNLFPILRRRKALTIGIVLLCFSSALLAINHSAQKPALSLSIESHKHYKSLPLEKKQSEDIAFTKTFNAAQNHYKTLKTRLSTFINNDGSLNLNTHKATKLLKSQTLTTFLKEKDEQEKAIETLSGRYGEKHPKMIKARTGLATKKTQITAEQKILLGALIDKYIAAKTTFDTLKKEQQHKEQEAQKNRSKVIPFLSSMPVPTPDIQFSKPTPPQIQLIGISLLASLFMGLLIPFIIERNRKTFLNGNQLSHTFGLPCYALIPEVFTFGYKNKPLADAVLDNPSDTLAEAVRSLRLNIKLKSKKTAHQDKVILLTSGTAGEGKTTLATWLGRLAAQSGERVLLIDANLRTPMLYEALNVPGSKNGATLIEYLSGKAAYEDIIDSSDQSNLHIIYSRSVPGSAINLLSSNKMAALLSKLKDAYDLILIDTPPCLNHTDAQALCPHADLLLYFVHWNKTKRDVIHKGLSQFLSFKHLHTGLVLSRIDLEKHIKYGYGTLIYEDEDE